ncbi:alpha/beta hydrolase [Pseudoteredinibacter isoporae]|uniref:Alpha-beta hydrolase superfamily lysophospholipase n=2 Tax=Pseudoteredinibacter isoporae TaxID=570281 RepID=A0A7X0JU89_9GAMM|nr:alpha/beta fold hydrolase [Pseudoteredinibacter isoporae]MBB6522262.1 alpha-beta hydrolase superfamily lysophospholipase [Pseudoteredinibacter isoporae]NHO87795.1 alpha/beta hydrolase [Pseudoteredinibacter isoporae]NIB23874.1 alpha/beta hydrolase [Pseudoteredinibacter isoporae]
MKIVLLPGMDGTCLLFRDFIQELKRFEALPVSLPQHGPQDYDYLVEYVRSRLPNEPYILLAESFSGGIAARLLDGKIGDCRGIIYIASFLEPPRPSILKLVKYLPIKRLARMPFTDLIYKWLFLGPGTSEELIDQLKHAIDQVPEDTLKARLNVIQTTSPIEFKSALPAKYIRATHDNLVGHQHIEDFRSIHPKLSVVDIDGPHFLLQAQAQTCALEIEKFE